MEKKYLIDKDKRKHYASSACMGSDFTKEEVERNVRSMINRIDPNNGSDEFWKLIHSGPYSIDYTDSWVGKRIYSNQFGWIENPNGELKYRISVVVTKNGMSLSELVSESLLFISKQMIQK